MDRGLLLALPLDSVLIRVAVAVGVGAFAGHLLYRISLRSARARFAAAFIPVVAVMAALLFSLRSPQLPVLMLPSSSGAVLPIPVEHGYLDFAPMAVPLLLGGWLLVATALVARRVWRHFAAAKLCRSHADHYVPAALTKLVQTTAQHYAIPSPQIVITRNCRGGAYVSGLRRPSLVLSAMLLSQLDRDELEAVVAHELAHLARRDLLTAFAVGVLKDLLFFLPGRAWADRSLHRERERAADERAVGITAKPAALASSMLKAFELPHGRVATGVAALAPQGEFVSRIEALLAPQPVSRMRHRLELAAVGMLSIVTVIAAIGLPSVFRSDTTQRDGVAVMWSNPSTDAAFPQNEARVFTVYRTVATPVSADESVPVRTHIERQLDNRPSTFMSCTDSVCPSPATAVSLGLSPQRNTQSTSANTFRATPLREDQTSSVRLFWVANAR